VIFFYSNGCHIKDKNSLKVIGSVEMQDRLYILRVHFYQKHQIKFIQFTKAQTRILQLLELPVYEKVVTYVLFLILRVGMGHSSMREKDLTIITSDDPSKGSVHARGYHLKQYLARIMMVWWVKNL